MELDLNDQGGPYGAIKMASWFQGRSRIWERNYPELSGSSHGSPPFHLLFKEVILNFTEQKEQ